MDSSTKFLIVFFCGIVGGWVLGLVDGWFGFAAAVAIGGIGAVLSGFAAASVEDTL